MSSQSNGGDPSAILANRLELVERAADDLAHEIKNPLHSMVINLEVLRRRVGRLDEIGKADVIHYVEVLGTELDRLTHRVEVLLSLLRPARGGDPVPLNELVSELWELVQLEAARKSVIVSFVPHQRVDNGYVPREPTRQVILNLVLELLEVLRPGEQLDVVAEIDDEELRLAFTGAASGDNQAVESFASTLDGRGRLGIARALTDSIGGRIEATGATPQLAFLLSIPRSA